MDDSLFQLEGRSVLIMGGGQGIDESTARLLARVGCGVAVADINREEAERVAAAVADLGQPSTVIVGDVLDEGQAKNIVKHAEHDLGSLDALVTVVGQASFNSILDMTPKQWDHDHRKNLRHFFFTAREVSRSLIEHRRPAT